MKEKYENEISNLKKSHESELNNINTAHRDQLKRETDELKADKEKTVASITTQHNSTI